MADDGILPFQLQSSRIRGRVVRLGDALNGILSWHDYPDDVLTLTGETLILCTLLSSMLKYEGIFTLQTQGDGPVKMVVADMMSDGQIRACAAFSADKMKDASYQKNRAELLGKGHMAFTVDQGEFAERYQGIVELKTESLVSSVQHYFAQSEQINTGIVMAIGKVGGKWRGSGIMVQQMPEESGVYNKDLSNVDEDDWRRTMVLLSSVKDEEMTDPSLSAEDLLYRLFHEEGIRVFESLTLKSSCRCSPERVKNILSGMSEDDLRDVTVDGKIVMTCEFCSTDYTFDPATIRKEKNP